MEAKVRNRGDGVDAIPGGIGARSTSTGTAANAATDESQNIFRDTPLRYLGYANEIGESFRYQFPRLVRPSYVVSFGYCLADAAGIGYRAWRDEQGGHHRLVGSGSSPSPSQSVGGGKDANVSAAAAALDALLWQSLASVMIPGATIHAVVKASRFAVARAASSSSSSIKIMPLAAATWLPTAVGIASIPIIIHPIDRLVDYALDRTTRKFFAPRRTEGVGGDGEKS